MEGPGDDMREKSIECCIWLPALRQFSFSYFLLLCFVLLFLVCSGVIQAPDNFQELFFTSIFSPDSEHIFCLFQRAHQASRSCRTDGTMLRFSLANGQMQLLCSFPLASALRRDVCPASQAAMAQAQPWALALVWDLAFSSLKEQTSPHRQHSNQTRTPSFPADVQEKQTLGKHKSPRGCRESESTEPTWKLT